MIRRGRPLRILLATDAFPPVCGGSGWSTYELARALTRLGHDVLIVQPRASRARGLSEREYEGLPVVEVQFFAPGVPFLRNYFKSERLTPRLGAVLADLARQHRIDVVHGQHVLTGPATVRAGELSARPTVCTVRDYWPVCYWSDLIHDPEATSLCPACTVVGMTRCVRPRSSVWPLAWPMIPYMRGDLARKRHALAAAGAIVAVSTAIARDLRERAPELRQSRIEVIPNPVDLDAIRATAARQSRPAGEPYAVFAGKLEVNKGVRHLPGAIADAALRLPVVVVGDGSLRATLETEARARGIDLRVLGWRPREETLAWLAHAAFVLFPSHGPESLSRVLLEAGALGVPAAAMDTGGTRDIVVHEVTGLLSATPAQFASHIARLAGDASLRARLGAGVREHVEQRFSAAHVAARTETLYRDLLAGDEEDTGDV